VSGRCPPPEGLLGWLDEPATAGAADHLAACAACRGDLADLARVRSLARALRAPPSSGRRRARSRGQGALGALATVAATLLVGILGAEPVLRRRIAPDGRPAPATFTDAWPGPRAIFWTASGAPGSGPEVGR
jgi:hypothetical protein